MTSSKDDVPVFCMVFVGKLKVRRHGDHLPEVDVESSTLYKLGNVRAVTGVHHDGPGGRIMASRVRKDGVFGDPQIEIPSRQSLTDIGSGLPNVLAMDVEGNKLVHKFRCLNRAGFAVYEHWGSTISMALLHK